MIKTKRALTSFLIFVSILMLAVPVIPHHHHTNGLMCMKNDITSDCCDCAHHPENNAPFSHHCCENTHCATAFFTPNAPTDNDCDFRPTYLWVSTLFYEPVFELLLLPEEKKQEQSSFYIESLHGIRIATSTGLRAPPATRI